MRLESDIEFYDALHRRSMYAQDALAIRERQALLRHLLVDAKAPVLVVGCGSAGEMSVLSTGTRSFGMDISLQAVEQSRSNFPHAHYLVADAAYLPFPDSCFGSILCSEVIEHVRDSERALGEIGRVMVRGGRLVLTTPNWLSWYGLARVAARLLLRKELTSSDQPYDRWSTLSSLKAQLERAGFRPQRWLGFWFFPPFGKGARRLPDRIVVPLLRVLMPVERLLRVRLPRFGHALCVVAFKNGASGR